MCFCTLNPIRPPTPSMFRLLSCRRVKSKYTPILPWFLVSVLPGGLIWAPAAGTRTARPSAAMHSVAKFFMFLALLHPELVFTTRQQSIPHGPLHELSASTGLLVCLIPLNSSL